MSLKGRNNFSHRAPSWPQRHATIKETSPNARRACGGAPWGGGECARTPSLGLVHHSDRGCQYASAAYRKALEANGLVGSMSRKGNCWDNAVAESFFATLKGDFVDHVDFATRAEARTAISAVSTRLAERAHVDPPTLRKHPRGPTPKKTKG